MAVSLKLDLGSVEHAVFRADDLRLEIGGDDTASLAIGRLSIGTRQWVGIRLHCGGFKLSDGEIRCRDGRATVPGVVSRASIDLRLDAAGKTGELILRTPQDETLAARLHPDGRAAIRVEGLSLSRLADFAEGLGAWRPDGLFDGAVDYRPAKAGDVLQISGVIRQGVFTSADGLHAAENLGVTLAATAVARGDGWDWRGDFSWDAGEAYLHPVYLVAGVSAEMAGQWTDTHLTIQRASLAIEGIRAVDASAEVSLGPLQLQEAAFALAEADMAIIGPRFVAPLIAPARVGSLTFEGHADVGIRLEGKELVGLDLALDGVRIVMADADIDVGPVSGDVPWRRDGGATEARLNVGGGRWQALAFGAFDVEARIDGNSAVFERIAVPLLDGRVLLDDLALRRDASGWTGNGAAIVEPISMSLLTDALDLPTMSGVLSASMPGMIVSPGRLALDGTLVVSVFDGYVQVSNLQVLEPFGIGAYLYSDVVARNIDLAQLTDTFSFGSVTGFVDMDLLGLELAHWRPVRFDAGIRSSPGRYPRRISQRAVQNIGALGGAGAALAIQRGFLGFFESFGYREIGLSCVLADGVCEMGGLGNREDGRGGFTIVRGGGVPALNVIGYNRRVDWNELVDRLLRVVESNTAPVIQ